jgi:transposase
VDDRLKGTRYGWLRNAVNMSNEERARFVAIRTSGLRTAKAWAMKFVATGIWDYRYVRLARKTFKRWYNWAVRSRLEPVIRVAKIDGLKARQHFHVYEAPDHQCGE